MQAFAALTDPGRVRSNNEDAVLAEALPDGSLLLAVADGVGGGPGGEFASALAVRALAEEVRKAGSDRERGCLRDAVVRAQERVLRAVEEKPEMKGAATTLVAALVRQDGGCIANVGDSRAYIIDTNGITQLTEDHTWVAEQVRAGAMTEEDAATNRLRSVITRAVGIEPADDADVHPHTALPPGASLLLCSDGLHGVVSAEDIRNAVVGRGPEEAARLLVRLANEAGGPDNIAVALVQH